MVAVWSVPEAGRRVASYFMVLDADDAHASLC